MCAWVKDQARGEKVIRQDRKYLGIRIRIWTKEKRVREEKDLPLIRYP